MTDPTMPSLDIFKAQSAINVRSVLDSVEESKEQERIQNFIQKRKAETNVVKQETEEFVQNNKISHFQEPVNAKDYPQDRKTEQRYEDEKKENFEKRIENTDGSYIEQLEKDLKEARDSYSKIQYNESLRLLEIRKKLKSDAIDEGIMTKEARERYEKTLERLKVAKLEELKNSGLKGKKMEQGALELIQKFGYTEAFELYNSRSLAKAEEKMGHTWAEKIWGMMEKTATVYNKLPLWKKVGLSAATFAAGAVGATALVGAKRFVGGMIAGVGIAKGLDALHQTSMKKHSRKDAEEFFKKAEGIDRDAGFEALKNLLDAKLENIDEQIKTIRKVSLANKFIGATAGILLGTGMVSKAFGAALHHFSGEAVGVATTGSGIKYEDFKAANAVNSEGSFDKVASLKNPYFHEGMKRDYLNGQVDMHAASLEANHHPATIKLSEPIKDAHGHMRHDSFTKSLRNYMQHEVGMDKAEASHAAELAMHDAAKQYAIDHHITPEQAMAKLGKVHPGTTYELTWDEHGTPHVHINDENVKFVKTASHHHVAGNVSTGQVPEYTNPDAKHLGDTTGAISQPPTNLPTNGAADSYASFSQQINEGTTRDWNPDSISHAQEEVARLDHEYETEVGKMFHQGGRHALDRDLSGIDRIDSARKYWKDYLLRFDQMSDVQKYTDLRKDFFDKDISKFRSLRNISVLNADGKLNMEAINQAGLGEKSKNLIGAFANSEVRPLAGESFEKWTVRIANFAKKTTELKQEFKAAA